MAKNLAIKKIQGVSDISKPKQIIKKTISLQENEKKPSILYNFFEDSFFFKGQPKIQTKIAIPSALLQQIFINFQIT